MTAVTTYLINRARNINLPLTDLRQILLHQRIA